MTQRPQQINLYQHTSQGLAAFTARTSLITLGITGAALLAVWAFGLWQVSSLERALARINDLQQQQQSLKQMIVTDPLVLSAQLQQLQTQAGIRKRSLDLLSTRTASASSFTPRLEALARHHVEGVWLDHILLTNVHGVSSIGGGAVSVELIPQYLHSLTSEQSLTGTAFSEFRVEGRYLSNASEDSNADAQASGAGYRFSATNSLPPPDAVDGAALQSG